MLKTESDGSKIILKAIAIADFQYPLLMLLMIPIGMTLNSALMHSCAARCELVASETRFQLPSRDPQLARYVYLLHPFHALL